MRLLNITSSALLPLMAGLALASCSSDDPEVTPQGEYTDIEMLTSRRLKAEFYLINEGNMGANKCTVDYVDLGDARYYSDIYATNNPDKVLELGDTGNDAAIYDGVLYVVVNGSHKVEAINAADCRSLGQIDIDSPRYVAFDGKGNGYVSSYVGGEGQNGSLVKFDTATRRITGSVSLGGCPEQIAITGGKAYVVNSGIYPDFENTVSVVDLSRFEVEGVIAVAPNMHHIIADADGNLWANSRGDYSTVPSRLYRIVPGARPTDATVTEIPVAVSGMTIAGNNLYTYASEWSYVTNSNVITYSCVNRSTCALVTDALTEALNTQTDIVTPYDICYDSEDNIMMLTDARNYVSSGNLIGYGMDGTRLFEHKTGDIPGHIIFR